MFAAPMSALLLVVAVPFALSIVCSSSAAADFETVGEVQLGARRVRVEVDRTPGVVAARFAIDELAGDGSVTGTRFVENASTQVLSASQQPALVWTAERELLVVAARDGLQTWEFEADGDLAIVGALALVDVDAPDRDRPWQFAVQYPWLFAAGGEAQTLLVVDLADPESPEVVDETMLANHLDGALVALEAWGETLRLSDGATVALADTSDPRRPLPIPSSAAGGVDAADGADAATERALLSRFSFASVQEQGGPLATWQPTLVRAAAPERALGVAVTTQGGVQTLAALAPLAADTTYTFDAPDGASRTISTGRAFATVDIRLSTSGASAVGEEAVFGARCDAATGQWSFDFGDGSAPTAWSSEPIAFHSFSAPGLYRVTATLRHGNAVSSRVVEHGVVFEPTAAQPRKSSTIVYDGERQRVWCVNPDNDTVSCVDHARGVLLMEIPTGKEPRQLALAADRTLWVTNEEAWSITVLDADSGQVLETLALPFACRPFGIVHSPDETTYVATLGTQEVLRFDTLERTLIGRIHADGPLRGLAVSGDGRTVLATRWISPQANGQLVVATPADFEGGGDAPNQTQARTAARVQVLAENVGPDSRFGGRGVPNHVADVAITPDGRRAWIAAKKDNTSRGLVRDGQPFTFFNTVRPMAAVYDLVRRTDDASARIDFGARDFPVAVAFTPLGEYGFMAMRGSRSVEVFDPTDSQVLFTIDGLGVAPTGLCVDPDRQLLVVHNFLTRDLSVLSLAPLMSGTAHEAPLVGRVRTVTVEILRGPVLPGKQFFHTAVDARMSRLGHVSCASCHFDSGHDGRVWDFTDRGEGLRNTISLQGRQGTGHGLVHWTANFNEVQDFEQDMRLAQGGRGFMADHLWRASADALGYDKRGLSPELDAINSYVSTFDRFPPSPYRAQDGTLTESGQRGKQLFERLECWQCHGGRTYTDFQFGTLHDIGTLTPLSGSRIGDRLPGIDTPTLRGIWETAPYFHDGSAATLMDVLERTGLTGGHEKTTELSGAERADLVAYLLQIDGIEPPARDTVRQPDAVVAFETLPQRAGLEDLFVLTANDWPVIAPRVRVGAKVHADASAVFTDVPEFLAPAYRLHTALADADEEAGTDAPVLELTTRHDVTLTIGLDARATRVPAWLADFTEREERVGAGATTYRLFEKRVPAGVEMSLGANPEAGLTTYLVFLRRGM